MLGEGETRETTDPFLFELFFFFLPFRAEVATIVSMSTDIDFMLRVILLLFPRYTMLPSHVTSKQKPEIEAGSKHFPVPLKKQN